MKRVIRFAAGLCLTVIVWALAVNFFVIGSAKRHITKPSDVGEGYDCILVLGCQVNGDMPSDMLKDRLDRAIALYKDGASDAILMSGDRLSRPGYDEVSVMRQYAVAQGVPSEAVLCDPAGYSTYESMCRAG